LWSWKPKAAEKLGVPEVVAKPEAAPVEEPAKVEEPAPAPPPEQAAQVEEPEVPTTEPTAPKVTWQELEAGLSPNTRTFLSMLQSRTRLTISAAQDALGLPQGKAVGGMIGALTQKATKLDLPLPFSSVKSRSGQRMWAWLPSVAKKLGIETVVKEAVAEEAEPVEAKVEEPGGSRT